MLQLPVHFKQQDSFGSTSSTTICEACCVSVSQGRPAPLSHSSQYARTARSQPPPALSRSSCFAAVARSEKVASPIPGSSCCAAADR
jgi:hypothetical protein